MSRSNGFSIALSLVLLLAGCNGLQPSGTASPMDSPSPTATPTETATQQGFPPGVTADGVSEPFALAEAHAEILADSSYTVSEEAEIRFRNGTLYASDVTTVQVAETDAVYRYNSSVRGVEPNCRAGCGNGTLVAYSNGTAVFRKVYYAFENDTEYRLYTTANGEPVDPSAVYHGTPRNTERIAVVLGRASNGSVERGTAGTYQLQASGLAVESLSFDGTTVRNLSAVSITAAITADGLVESYTVSVRGTVNGEPVMATERVRYSELGTTDVVRPDWYDEAVRAHQNRTSG